MQIIVLVRSAGCVVRCGDAVVHLPPQVGRLIAAIVAGRGRTVSHARLENVTGVARNVVRVHLHWGKMRLGRAGIPWFVRASWGQGYRTEGALLADDEALTVSRDGTRLIRRLIERCPSPLLAEQARQTIFR